MTKLKMQTKDYTEENARKLMELFPNIVTESTDINGNVIRAIDKDKLEQEINATVVAGPQQRYEFTWPDKKQAQITARTPINKTLRPCREESVNFDTTENLYIEGDNLEVLKLLQETYLGKIKMIYIDPPYNTGHDFVYNDNFTGNREEWLGNSGDYDAEGNLLVDRMTLNTERNGRFHTDWLNMMYPRLRLAKNLLTDDGVIFISIDDNEVRNLKILCDEIFGEQNFVAQVVWERAFSPVNLMKHFSVSHDYVLCYSRDIEKAVCNGIPRTEDNDNRYSNPDNDPRGVWSSSDISVGPAIESNIYAIKTPSGRFVEPPAGRSWRLSEKAFSERLKDNRIWFGPNGDGVPRIKRFLSELRKQGVTPMTIWKHMDVGHSQGATQDLAKMFDGKKYFDYPKPVGLIERCCQLYSSQDCIVLDFFSGSATTAHAVMQLNAEDGGKRKFIMVQLPEKCDEKSEAFKAGYKNICEIGKERIRRAGKKIVGSREQGVGSSTEKGAGSNYGTGIQGVDCVAEGDAGGEASLFADGKVSKAGNVCFSRPNSQGGSIYSEQYSGGECQDKPKGVCAFSGDSQGLQSRSGDAIDFGDNDRLPKGAGCSAGDGAASGSGKVTYSDNQKPNCNNIKPIPYSLLPNTYIDIGFRVLKVDDSNMEDVYYTPNKVEQVDINMFAENIKPDRTPMDLLFQVMLDLGVELSSKIETKEVKGKMIYSVDNNYLVVCFDDTLDDEVITAIAKLQPVYFVTRDSSIATDSVFTNFEQIFMTYSKDTIRKVL